MTNAQCIYGRRPAPGEPGLAPDCRPSWREDLGPVWLDRVVPPRSFQVYRDHEIPARRVVGHDGDDVPCFQAYDYRRLDVRSDDDEEYYLAVAYSESLSAWRLHDGRWLVYRRVEPLGEEDAATCVLSIDDRMPR
ncbi:hypothetical protein [Thiocapsa bogorovii]|uniref:hypothetical protein n=1 Tax=Thiocapsa bogorovii TaxID=521689 RepID=UPI001E2D3A15|nr:hypothetical protein [Thiocapsa bogorovii]UHD17398.1 hypothetical protein LT988_04940 [Thiocapsa bogorovii]